MFQVVKHEVFDHKKWKRRILLQLLRKKSFRKRFFHSDFFYQQILAISPIPCRRLDELVDCQRLSLENFFSRNGNLSLYEVVSIVALIAHAKPKRLLEIGTFDGNTTLQMGLNAPEDALIHTIDLPLDATATKEPVLESDIQFICDEKKNQRKFQGSTVEYKIRQHFGDSTEYDFSRFTEDGPLDFIFIDGGHSYACIKSDTQNALQVLNEGGLILWHDFTPHFGGVFQFLCELGQSLALTHIEGTNLVLYKAEKVKSSTYTRLGHKL